MIVTNLILILYHTYFVAMIAHIRSIFKPMYDLFVVMKGRETPTADEILMASGKKNFDDSIREEYLKIIETQSLGIKEAFAKQQAKDSVCNLLYIIFEIPFFLS
jgi:hypothetical protein